MKLTIWSTLFCCYVGTLSAAITFPQMALGGGFEVVLLISNERNLGWSGRAVLRQARDEDWTGEWTVNRLGVPGTTQFELDLPGKGTEKYVIRGDSALRAGYLVIEGKTGFPTEDIAVSLFYNLLEDRQLIDSTGIPPAAAGDGFIFPVEKGLQVNTGMAWASATFTIPFEIVVILHDHSGVEVGRKSMIYEGHFAAFFDELFEGVSPGFRGLVLIESEQLMHLTVLRLEVTPSGSQLTSVPPGSL